MSTVDNRAMWEVELCLRIKFAAHYLDIMSSTGIHRQLLQVAHSQDLDKWCIKNIEGILEKCQRLVDVNGQPSNLALDVAAPSLARLKAAHFNCLQ